MTAVGNIRATPTDLETIQVPKCTAASLLTGQTTLSHALDRYYDLKKEKDDHHRLNQHLDTLGGKRAAMRRRGDWRGMRRGWKGGGSAECR